MEAHLAEMEAVNCFAAGVTMVMTKASSMAASGPSKDVCAVRDQSLQVTSTCRRRPCVGRTPLTPLTRTAVFPTTGSRFRSCRGGEECEGRSGDDTGRHWHGPKRRSRAPVTTNAWVWSSMHCLLPNAPCASH